MSLLHSVYVRFAIVSIFLLTLVCIAQVLLIARNTTLFASASQKLASAPIESQATSNNPYLERLRRLSSTSSATLLEQNYLRASMIGSLFLSLSCLVIVGVTVYYFIIRRYRLVTSVVSKFAKGDFAHRIPIRSKDEIGELASTVNSMADRIVADIKALREADALRRELVANVSHDLRSPITSIRGYLETIYLRKEKLSEQELEEHLQVAIKNTKTLAHQVDDLFELSKLEAKAIDPIFEPCALGDLAEDVVLKFKPIAQANGINLTCSVADELPLVQADIGMLDRAMVNLVSNAINHTNPNGTVKVSVLTAQANIRVTVEDSGVGIPADEITQVFDRYYRASTTLTSTGTGLGLTITKRIIEVHDGEVGVNSTLGQGSIFWFTVPL